MGEVERERERVRAKGERNVRQYVHVYKLINLCTCVCRSYTSGCRQNAEEEKKKKGRDRRGDETGGEEIKRRLEEGSRGRRAKGG